MAVLQYPSPLPPGCRREIITHTSGRQPVVVFPDGEIVDAAVAPFWRYRDDLYVKYAVAAAINTRRLYHGNQ